MRAYCPFCNESGEMVRDGLSPDARSNRFVLSTIFFLALQAGLSYILLKFAWGKVDFSIWIVIPFLIAALVGALIGAQFILYYDKWHFKCPKCGAHNYSGVWESGRLG